jgi:hypothetical protein
LKVDITKLNPPQQVEVLISTLEKEGDIAVGKRREISQEQDRNKHRKMSEISTGTI